MKKFKTLKKKITFSTVLMILVVVAVNMLVGIIISYKGLEHNVEHDLRTMGQLANTAIKGSLDNMSQELKSAASMDDIDETDTAGSSSQWISKIDSRKNTYGMKELYVADKSGNIMSSDQALNGKNIADTDYFKNALIGNTYFSTTEKDLKGDLVIFASTPVSGNTFSGVMIAEFSSQTLSNIIKDIRVGNTGNVFIIDKNGKMIANMRKALVDQQQNFITMANKDKKYSVAAKVYKKMTEGKTGTDIYPYESEKRICYYAPVNGTNGWSYGVVAPIKEMTSSIYEIILGMAIVSVILVLISILLAVKLSSLIASPVKQCSDRLAKLSAGDLHSGVPEVNTEDETGILARSTVTLVENLRRIIGDETRLLKEMSDGNLDVAPDPECYTGDFKPMYKSIMQIISSLNHAFLNISRAADQVAEGSDEVAGSSQSLASGATEQASAIEEVSATITEISGKANDNADEAGKANREVFKVGCELENSNDKMRSLANAMNTIRDYSDKINNIIKTIEDIAFQTNILALNAAVEAAHAGEAGKGFAVVADEIRSLAGRSAKASKSTSQLITGTAQAVEQGVKIADETAQSLNTVVDGEKQIITVFEQISNSSIGQSDAVKQATQGIEQVSAVVQTNSATAQESAAASEELSGQAQEMKKLLSVFKLKKQI